MTVPRIWRNIPFYYNLIGRKCPGCNRYYFPPRDVCRDCGNKTLEHHKFSGNGTILTFTVIRTSMADPEGEMTDVPARNIPYVLAIIKLDEGPCLTAEIVEAEIEDISIGRKVSAVFRKIAEKGPRGVIQYGYKFALN